MKVTVWITLVVLALVVGAMLFEAFYAVGELKKNGELIHVRIEQVLPPSKGGSPYGFACSFTYHGVQKTLNSATSQREHLGKYTNKECPALYSPKSDNIRVLITQDDFDRYDVPLTDSLLHVIDHLNRGLQGN
jgi:hypothetical protein